MITVTMKWLNASLFRILLAILFSISSLWNPFHSARAQGEGWLEIESIDASKFPEVQIYFSAYDSQSRFLSSIQGEEITILENDKSLSPAFFEPVDPGVSFTLAWNLGPDMNNRFNNRTSLETLQTAALNWVQTIEPGTQDIFSLAGNTGLQAIRLTSGEDWQAAMEAYQPDPQEAKPSLTSLIKAVELGEDAGVPALSREAVLYITTLPNEEMLTGLPDLIERARQNNVHVFVWLAAPENAAARSPQAVELLQTLANETNGSYFHFTGKGTLPDIENYLSPLRRMYHITYQSSGNTTGIQEFSLQINQPDLEITSEPASFAVVLSEPEPIFLSPPDTIVRTWQVPESGGDALLQPQQTTLKALINFPDQHPRELRLSRLLVNGFIVEEHTSAPFDQFDWDLSSYTTSSEVKLKIEVEDIYGMRAVTLEHPVKVLVEIQPRSMVMNLSSSQSAYWIYVVGLSVAALVLLGLILVRRKMSKPREYHPRITRPEKEKPTEPKEMEPKRPAFWQHATIPTTSAPAWLLCLAEDADLHPGYPLISSSSKPKIPLNRREITLGSDPAAAIFAIHSLSVSPIHARIYQPSQNDFIIVDIGSTAGTWVNFHLVPPEGVHLVHGDLIHLGRAVFRFETAKPPNVNPPRVSPTSEWL